MQDIKKGLSPEGRLVSLDAFRGLTMIFLISGAFGFSYLLDYPYLDFFAKQFTHHPWHGMYFWDLIQPFFMFIVGVAMPFSFMKRLERGDTWNQIFHHVLKRSIILLFLGTVIIPCALQHKLVFEMWNVLAQLAFTYFIAFLFMKKTIRIQVIISFAILLFNYLIYRFIPLPGVTDPWEPSSNLGAFVDSIVIGKLSEGHWVTINFIGSTAHTMWGVVAGQILMSSRADAKKLKIMIISGIIGVVFGLALDPITPIAKHICTSSFIIYSGGFCFLAFSLFFWIIEIKEYKKWAHFMVIVGMNPIFIYMFFQVFGERTNEFIGLFTKPTFEYIGVVGKIIHKNIVLLIYWYLTYWLYKRKIFIKI